MPGSPSDRAASAELRRLRLTLPPVLAPDASYVPVTCSGRTAYVSGQLPRADDGTVPVRGRLGVDVTVPKGQQCAQRCALHLLAQLDSTLGSLDCVERLLKVHVYVASGDGFAEQHVVANGASDLLYEVLGERGRHARSAIGVAYLPYDSPVEVDAIVAVDPDAAALQGSPSLSGAMRER
jgi:enamine deaminase RidA (YjgF/YER057c/UK114 family)